MRTVQSFVAEEKEFGRFVDAIGNPDEGNILLYPKGTEGEGDGKRNTLQVGYSKATVTSTFFTLMFGGGSESCFGIDAPANQTWAYSLTILFSFFPSDRAVHLAVVWVPPRERRVDEYRRPDCLPVVCLPGGFRHRSR